MAETFCSQMKVGNNMFSPLGQAVMFKNLPKVTNQKGNHDI